ncbi:ShlB/FhaC/HecB family hemolysin secretion/activation protein [Chitinimonas sp. BJB300]|uniref:ShlB/FhaC/HecB family hemolysin secretion/activation protein n=2 Tax=Chitinimonas sp. BJB300 TaxID=1559339 RepID=UPI0016424F53|nr:ShlB/FhaC/HecB family hemolysin secretion/activation protein [Chitinimonas sp. BJB300]
MAHCTTYHRRQARCCRRTKRAQQIVGVQIEFFVLHGDRLSYALRNISYSYQQPLSGGFSLQGWLEGQYAEKNLDSSEQFTLGGPSDIRAYPVGEAQGDRGGRASLELRYDVPKVVPSLGRLQLATFVDTGNIAVNSESSGIAISTATGRNSYALKGWGLGASLFKPNQYSLRLAWAHKIGSNPGRSAMGDDVDGKHHASRVWLQGILWF